MKQLALLLEDLTRTGLSRVKGLAGEVSSNRRERIGFFEREVILEVVAVNLTVFAADFRGFEAVF